ncbi:Basigin [Nymphon striatum]|nr:Basigin [Nymphon striatum]
MGLFWEFEYRSWTHEDVKTFLEMLSKKAICRLCDKQNTKFVPVGYELYETLQYLDNEIVTYEGYRYVDVGKPFTIQCYLSLFDTPRWMKDNIDLGKILNPEEYETSSKTENKVVRLTFSVDQAKKEHTGNYKCTGFSTNTHRIEVVLKDGMEDQKDTVFMQIGEELKLKCDADPQTLLPVKWQVFILLDNMFKGQSMILNDSRVILVKNQLTIKKAREEDAGEYKCEITANESNRPSPECEKKNGACGEIHVYYKAMVKPLFSRMSVVLGRPLELKCQTRGYPIPRLMWYINDSSVDELQKSTSRFRMAQNKHNGLPNALFIIDKLRAEDVGEYKCQAKNAVGDVNTTTFITLRVTDDVTDFTTSMHEITEPTDVVENIQNTLKNAMLTNEKEAGKGLVLSPDETLYLQCIYTDDEAVEVKWRKDGQEINTTDSRREMPGNNTIKIEEPNDSDTGNYTCFYRDISAVITVRTKVEIEPFHKSMNLVEGDRLTLICKVHGIPAPSIEWYKGDDLIDHTFTRIEISDSEKSKNAKLVIESLEFEDRAHYKCFAKSEVDDASTSILVRVKDKYAALWPFLGICAEVAVLCTIIFIYEKRRSKPDFAESDTDNCPETKNTADNKGQELRQRK